MITPRMGQRPPEGVPWAADNGRFSAPQNYSDEKYLAWLGRMPVASCLFATAPDVLGDAAATLALSVPMLPRIRSLGYPVALVAQDGLTPDMVPWDAIDALFIGGTTDWKLGAASESLCRQAKAHGLHVHVGRVNSWKRMELLRSWGCVDSCDGTVLKHDPERPVQEWMDRASANPHIWEAPR